MVVHFTLNSSNLSKKYKVAMTSENVLSSYSFDVSTRVFFWHKRQGRRKVQKFFGQYMVGWAMSPMPPLPSSSGPIRKLLIKVLSANLEIERIVSRLQDLNVFFVIWSKVVCNINIYSSSAMNLSRWVGKVLGFLRMPQKFDKATT